MSLPQHIENRLDLWPRPSPTDLNIDRDHALMKDYLPSKCVAYWAKHSWALSCTRYWRPTWPLTLTSDLRTEISIGIIYLARTIIYQFWCLCGKVFLSYRLQKVKGYRHTDRTTDQPTDTCKAICLAFLEEGHKYKYPTINQYITALLESDTSLILTNIAKYVYYGLKMRVPVKYEMKQKRNGTKRNKTDRNKNETKQNETNEIK